MWRFKSPCRPRRAKFYIFKCSLSDTFFIPLLASTFQIVSCRSLGSETKRLRLYPCLCYRDRPRKAYFKIRYHLFFFPYPKSFSVERFGAQYRWTFVSAENGLNFHLQKKTQNYSVPSFILRMCLIPLAVNYMEKNGAPQEWLHEGKRCLWYSLQSWWLKSVGKLEQSLVGLLKDGLSSSSVQVLFLMLSKRLIYLRPACCLLALSRNVERISKRPISDSTCFHPLWLLLKSHAS